MKQYMDIIKNMPLFDGIDCSQSLILLKCMDASIKQYRKNSTVFFEGEKAEFIGIVLEGSVIVSRNDYYGNRNIISEISSPNMFGETFACLNESTIPVNVTAGEESTILFINCKKLINTCDNKCTYHSKVIQNLISIFAKKNIMLNRKLEIMSKRTTKEKIMSYLLDEAKKAGSSSFFIPYDRQALADYLGVERSAMSAEISKMKNDGIIETKRSWFKLL